MTARVTFVILTHERPAELLDCLESLERAGAALGARALVAFNGSEPSLEPLFEELPRRFPWVRTLRLERTCRGRARNLAVEALDGELVYFLDDDVTVPSGFVGEVLAAFDRHPRAPAVGGPNLGPSPAPAFQRAVDFLLRSPLGAGPMRVRHDRRGAERRAPGWCFTLCNLGVRREVFSGRGVLFPERCASAEENLFLYRVELLLGRAALCPALSVFHRRRPGAWSFARQVFASGRGRMQITRAEPGSLQAAVLAPAALAGYAALLPFLPLGPGAWTPLALYGAACLAEAARLAWAEDDGPAALRLVFLLPLAHLAYAAGTAAGIFSELVS